MLLLFHHLQTSGDMLVHACGNLMPHFPPSKSVLFQAVAIASTLYLGDILGYDAKQLKAAVCVA